jgi:HK97 family phage portal protein
MSWYSRVKAFGAGLVGGMRKAGLEIIRIAAPWQTQAGVYVNADTALKNATVWACVTYLSRTTAQLPWRVMQDLSAGPKRAPMHPVNWVLNWRPNPEMSPFTFKETMVGWACRRGNAVAEIQRDARGVPVALWPIHPTRVEFDRDQDTGELLYQVQDDGGTWRTLRGMDVFHLRGFGEGAVGLDVVSYAAESIGWAQATEIFGAGFFSNGLNPSGFLMVPGRLSVDAKKAIDDEIDARHGGVKQGHRVMVLDGQMKFEKASVEPDHAQFIETRQHQVEEICRWFGVPPHKVMHLLRSTNNNIEHQSIEVVVDAITPWAMRIEQEGDYKLFGQNRMGYYTKMDLKGLLRGDFKSRQEGLQIQRRNGVINGNEWRRLEDMDEIGPDGDKYIVEGNMTTLEAVGQPPVAPQVDAGAQQDESPVQRARKQAARALLH